MGNALQEGENRPGPANWREIARRSIFSCEIQFGGALGAQFAPDGSLIDSLRVGALWRYGPPAYSFLRVADVSRGGVRRPLSDLGDRSIRRARFDYPSAKYAGSRRRRRFEAARRLPELRLPIRRRWSQKGESRNRGGGGARDPTGGELPNPEIKYPGRSLKPQFEPDGGRRPADRYNRSRNPGA